MRERHLRQAARGRGLLLKLLPMRLKEVADANMLLMSHEQLPVLCCKTVHMLEDCQRTVAGLVLEQHELAWPVRRSSMVPAVFQDLPPCAQQHSLGPLLPPFCGLTAQVPKMDSSLNVKDPEARASLLVSQKCRRSSRASSFASSCQNSRRCPAGRSAHDHIGSAALARQASTSTHRGRLQRRRDGNPGLLRVPVPDAGSASGRMRRWEGLRGQLRRMWARRCSPSSLVSGLSKADCGPRGCEQGLLPA